MFSRFFIHRPVFAIVISLVIMIAGGLSILALPIAQYPEITPPQIQVAAIYTGASAQVVEETVAAPIEQEVNGAENMIYMQSKSTNDGRYVLNVTFRVGTDIDIASVDIQNRISRANSRLPSEVLQAGITVKKQSPDILQVISLSSPGGAYDTIFLSNYAAINLLDQLSRIPGVGSADIVVGKRDYSMRLWLRPDKLAKLGITGGDIARVISDQNIQAAAGQIGQPPAPKGLDFQYSVNVKGRLTTIEEFENIIVRTLPDGGVLRIRDVAKTELGAQDYTSTGLLDGGPAVMILIYQLPGSNALDVAKGVRAKMAELAQNFPPGIEYGVRLDTTLFVTASVEEVLYTLLEAMLLVLLVVFVFLGNVRATIIPMLAVPVSLVGTFAAFVALGFSINLLTLFAMVLAIGIVVDDAIVVVEAAEHHIEEGLTPLAATEKAMEEVSGPVVAVALVLGSVFVPVAFMGGITGQLYRQFALTLTVSVLLSALVALTLTPALCAMLLRPRRPSRGPLGVFFRGFNAIFSRATAGYLGAVRTAIRHSVLALACLGVLYLVTWTLLERLPTGFLPDEDLGYIIVSVTLPDAASLERTDAALRKVEEILKAQSGVQSMVSFAGFGVLTGTYNSNAGTIFVPLKPWDQRKSRDQHALAIIDQLRRKVAAIPDAFILVFNPPPIRGLGNVGGFQFELQDRSGKDLAFLEGATSKLMAAAAQHAELVGMFTSFRPSVPQVKLDVDRDKVRTLGIPLSDVFQSLQIYLGSLFVNQFNLFGRTWRVYIQAEPEFRATTDGIAQMYTRTADGLMVPLSTITRVGETTGPDTIIRYNLYRTAEINGGAAPGYSSGQAISLMEQLARESLPQGAGFEWTGTAFQEKESGGKQGVIFGLALVFVFLSLAALYESWAIPFSVILGIPLGAFGAFLAVWLRALPSDIYVQIGLVMLIGLAAKNAILIVEFAKMRYEQGAGLAEAAVEAAQLRFRPILMTSFAFILGVVPLVIASGAGAGSRHSLGTAVFGGMTAATCLGVLVIPLLYVLIQGAAERFSGSGRRAPTAEPPASEAPSAAQAGPSSGS
ncbi:MAG TPA: multidrug efflux RND transporter permease subunit [Methylomirabilota bacterium]|nr:multidrug efflux RND transporter permease subunit [Methylomirabilota bacterium]